MEEAEGVEEDEEDKRQKNNTSFAFFYILF